jgi:hypothetical protein
VEVKKIVQGPSKEELEQEFGKILDHHRSVSADLSQLLPGVPEPGIDDT